MIRVLIADDQALVRGGFRLILDNASDITVIAEAANGDEAIAQCLEHHPDVALLDIRMPGTDGLEAAAAILSERSAGHVLMLTTFEVDDYVHAALQSGVSGYLLKDVDPPELVAAVRAAHGGDLPLAPAITRRLIEEFSKQRPVAPATDRLAVLTEREADVLRLMARGLSNAEIAGHLFLGESTVKTHVGHILDKLGLRDRVQAVILAYEAGLIRPGQL